MVKPVLCSGIQVKARPGLLRMRVPCHTCGNLCPSEGGNGSTGDAGKEALWLDLRLCGGWGGVAVGMTSLIQPLDGGVSFLNAD